MPAPPRTRHRIAVVDPESSPQRLELSAGLLEPRHLDAMGPALGLYLVLLARKPFGSPFVAGGRPLPAWTLQAATGAGARTVREHLRRLELAGYLELESVNRGPRRGSGVRIRITKAKDWKAGALRVYLEPEPRQESAAVPRRKSAAVRPDTPSGPATYGSLPHRFKRSPK